MKVPVCLTFTRNRKNVEKKKGEKMGDILKLWNRTSTVQRSFPAESDLISDTLATISFEHYKIHEGNSWHVEDTTADLGAEVGDFIDIQLTTPAAAVGYIHAMFNGYAGNAYTFDLREAQTGGGAGGSTLTAYNRDRASSNVHGATITKDDGVGTGGTVLFSETYASGVGPFTQMGVSRGSQEWILKAATLYQVRVYAAAAVAAFVSMDFYLHIKRH